MSKVIKDMPKRPPKKLPMSSRCTQGSLDNLCSIYSAINAVRWLCDPFSDKGCHRLLIELLKTYEKKHDLLNAVKEGLTANELHWLLQIVVEPKYGIKVSRPFYRKRHIKQASFFRAIRLWTNAGGVVIVYVGWHFSVVTKITSCNLMLYDSVDWHYLRRNVVCSSKADEEDRIKIRDCIFVIRKEDV